MAGDPYTKAQQLGGQRKKYRRKVASRKSWEALRDERLGPCLLCTAMGCPQEGPSELHHCVPRDRFGDDVASNLVPLCRLHHQAVEAGLGRVLRMLAEVIQRDEPAVYAYCIDKLGEDGFLRLHKVAFACTVDESAGLREAS